ncbi:MULTISPECIES: hypothetical protein [Metabacillus]|uniref:hypothetical protein n=1 Tax=Metabacillus TaxID=2675233 RepID=UPI000C8082DF|nr:MULTISPECIES: hypothetical protein [Metabacillus]MCM3443285.1 hypothetical protein [Metabacillus halosaccharovorans]PMC34206.1 hypothetical protein CJ195_24095 [Bacillus sp. UMB0899]
MKRIFIILSLICVVSIIAGCSSKKEAPSSNSPFQKSSNQGVVMDEATIKEFEKYSGKFEETLKQSNDLLRTFNRSLDGLYTGDNSDKQFAEIMKKNIESSRELIATVEEYEVSSAVTKYNQSLITYLNQQHQLFLEAVDMAINEDIDKDQLRSEYLEIKTIQTEIETAFLSGE